MTVDVAVNPSWPTFKPCTCAAPHDEVCQAAMKRAAEFCKLYRASRGVESGDGLGYWRWLEFATCFAAEEIIAAESAVEPKGVEGVGKLSPEPDLGAIYRTIEKRLLAGTISETWPDIWQHLKKELEELCETISATSTRSGRTTATGADVQPATPKIVRPCSSVPNAGDHTTNPKGVEGVGQTARESPTYEPIAAAGPEFYVEDSDLGSHLRSRSLSTELWGLGKARRAILEDLAQTLNHIVAINQQHFAARETLTLRAELLARALRELEWIVSRTDLNLKNGDMGDLFNLGMKCWLDRAKEIISEAKVQK